MDWKERRIQTVEDAAREVARMSYEWAIARDLVRRCRALAERGA